jgi:fructan beta-fructosidase
MIRTATILAVLPLALWARAADRPDVLVADFEGDAYPAGWTTTGTAFGTGPARGTLPNQMPVSGFLGKGLVNSFRGGDGSTGTLTSPAFKLERKYLNFLVGGGMHKDKTCINLLVGGKVVRTATGPNDRPGGSEHLDWHTWDITDLEGQSAVIQIVDEEKGGWGHVNVDQIAQSDRRRQAEPARREFAVDQPYLHLPVKTGAPQRRMKFTIGNETVREFDIELATDGKPDFWAFAEVGSFKGKTLTVETTLPADSKALDTLKLAVDVPDAEKLYREKHRPLFHFTSRFGWLNDPNGLVFDGQEYHLFYQHNPFGVNWGNMHWGHAVSPDLVHWKELGIGLYPRKYGDWAFSGSAVVDKGSTSGWGTKEKPPLVLAYTSTGRGECIAFSTDRGRTWTEYEKNPVVRHAGRDPKLVWYEPGKHWVMAVYDEFQGKQWIAFHTSPDLKAWTFASRIEGFFECPDLFEMPVMVGAFPKEAKGSKWVLYGADGKYLIGDFDGKEFKSDVKEKMQLWYGRFYAAQTFDNGPPPPYKPQLTELSGLPRRVQIGWANGVTFPGMPFNQQMTVPVQIGIFADKEGDPPRLKAFPIPELASLREEKPALLTGVNDTITVDKGRTLVDDLDAFEAWLVVDLGKSDGFTLNLRGTKLKYDAKKEVFTCKDVTAPAKMHEGKIGFRVFVDRGSIEVFVESEGVVMSVAAIPDQQNHKLECNPHGGEVTIQHSAVWRMKSAWGK